MEDQTNSTEADSKGSSNTVQDESCKSTNGTGVLNNSLDSTTSFATAPSLNNTSITTNVSMTSTSNLLVPNKLYLDIENFRVDYLRVVNDLNNKLINTKTASQPRSVELLLNEQVDMACKKVNKPDLIMHFKKLLSHAKAICVPQYKPDTRPKPSMSSHADGTAELFAKVESMASDYTTSFESMQKKLDSLTQSIDSFSKGIPDLTRLPSTLPMNLPPPPPQPIQIRDDAPSSIKHDETHIACSHPDYIGVEAGSALLEEATKFAYKAENGRGTVVFGESYDYKGSRNTPKPMPPTITAIMKQLNDEFKSATTPLNSCLVNIYSGPDSYLPSHSDDERCIHPESQIYTVSLGCKRTVKFGETITGKEFEFEAKHRSMYSMTRKSQEFFRHRIDRDRSLSPGDVRVSLTFRSVSWRNHNSTVILGDSNTGGLKFGNASKGQCFGESMPGKRVAAFTVSELDPTQALGYNNIVINCGLNNVRHSSVQSYDQVKDIYIDFKTKVDYIYVE